MQILYNDLHMDYTLPYSELWNLFSDTVWFDLTSPQCQRTNQDQRQHFEARQLFLKVNQKLSLHLRLRYHGHGELTYIHSCTA